MPRTQPRAVIGRYVGPAELTAAAREVRSRGYDRLDAYAPFAIDELPQALALPASRLRVVMFVAGLVGAAGGYLMQYYSAVVSYPVNSGGRPLHSWPAFLPVAFELAVLFAAVAGFVAMLAGCGLARLNHPFFDRADLEAASDDGFFLVVEADGPRFDARAAAKRLRASGAVSVEEWPA